MKYYIIAGEASGDLHASNLIKNIKSIDPQAQIRAWGGEKSESAGAFLVKHYKDLAFMGFLEVALNARTILNNIDFCKKDILEFQPDALILIDYPGFNLKIAKFAKNQGFKVFYYIAPQVWAWHASRVKMMKKYIDELFVILPFEKHYFSSKGMEVNFEGHPLLDVVDQSFSPLKLNQSKPIIALLPGSRKQEIRKLLPVMLSVVNEFPDYKFVIAASSHIGTEFYQNIIGDFPISMVYNQTYSLLKESSAALVKSGTSTLETALFNVPQVVCYKGSYISYKIARCLVRNIKYISLVNLILDKSAVVELIQTDFTSRKLTSELSKIIKNSEFRNKQLDDYKQLKATLGEKGSSFRVADAIISNIKRYTIENEK